MTRSFLLCFAAIISSGLALGIHAKDDADEPLSKKPTSIYREAEQIIKDTERVGRELTATLADEKVPIQVRLEAGRLLGEMRYLPAIPVLLKEARLREPGQIYSDGLKLPIQDSLIELDDAIFLMVLDAHLGPEGDKSGAARAILLRTYKFRPAVAIAEMRLAQSTDEKEKDRLRRRIRSMKDDIKTSSYIKEESLYLETKLKERSKNNFGS